MHEQGKWWIAQYLARDLASLNRMEMLPGDVWGMMPKATSEMSGEETNLLDCVAELTLVGVDALPKLQKIYQDERLRVPKVNSWEEYLMKVSRLMAIFAGTFAIALLSGSGHPGWSQSSGNRPDPHDATFACVSACLARSIVLSLARNWRTMSETSDKGIAWPTATYR